MFGSVLKLVLGNENDRHLKKVRPMVDKINLKFEEYESLSNDEVRGLTEKFKARYQGGESLDALLVEAFATVKQACKRMMGTPIDVVGNSRNWDMIPYDVQLIGGIGLHTGHIAEMMTGEGKTLVAVMPLYLNALSGKNCQLVTVNDYLALRDSMWVGAVLRWLGLTVGCIQNGQSPEERRNMYACDVTYGTNSEFGFDYLRDMGMANSKDELVQRDYYFCIIDEIDSILIDEARTPLIISGPVDVSTHKYDHYKPKVEKLYKQQLQLCNRLANQSKDIVMGEKDANDDEFEDAITDMFLVKLGMPKHKVFMRLMQEPHFRKIMDKKEQEAHSEQNRGMLQGLKDRLFFTIDERHNDADLSELGRQTISPNDPEHFVIPDLSTGMHKIDNDSSLSEDEKIAKREELQEYFEESTEVIHNISQLLKAYCLYEKDYHYIVQENKVVIVDEHTGRPMPGRRFSDGLHQALEAKEGVDIEKESQTLATVTIQNYFRMYDKLAGMTGTATTEKNEFKEIYSLKVLEIPTHRPCVRIDENDMIFKTKRDKYTAIIEDVKQRNAKGQPVLLGTASVDVSEVLSRMLKREKIEHAVLNAKYHQQEAEIVSKAGQISSVTIATNMAGRGTDIMLGEGVADLGGLYVIGSERHDSRRIDRQLRGRCARQGDPGCSRFYISLEDNLMRLFGGDRITGLLERFGFEDGEEISGSLLTKTIENAQRKVEQEHFSYRKHTLEYDNIMNEQRKIIYGNRKEALLAEDTRALLFDHIYAGIHFQLDGCRTNLKETGHVFDQDKFLIYLQAHFARIGFNEEIFKDVNAVNFKADPFVESITQEIEKVYVDYVKDEEAEFVEFIERQVILNAYDSMWKDHLDEMDYLRQSIRLHSYANKDPLVEYKKQAYHMFQDLMAAIDGEIASSLFRSSERIVERRKQIQDQFEREVEMHETFGQFEGSEKQAQPEMQVFQLPDGRQIAVPMGTPPEAVIAHLQQIGELPMAEQGSPIVTPEYPEEEPQEKQQPYVANEPKIGRNDPCPCGNGKKYKHCCGKP